MININNYNFGMIFELFKIIFNYFSYYYEKIVYVKFDDIEDYCGYVVL